MTKTVWITGAGKGIGRALALKMAKEGWVVAASARTKADLESLAIESEGARIHSYPLDITDVAENQNILDEIEKNLGALDLAVLNAGTHRPMSAKTFDVATVRALVETNLMGTVNGLGALVPTFRNRNRGRIAVVSSAAGYRGLPTSGAYGATKAALINMCEALKPELEKENVALTLINPGFVETPLTGENEFPMPFLVTSEEAAESIYKGLMAEKFEIVFPWKFALIMKFLRLLPNRFLFSLTSRMVTR
ncbi:MAG: SDR family NAD(P)-dependent oxidoreductase [Parvibaculaceae bacterium]|nr:SDR family NAD(P)-dependent oxidoreductase [Parvibaculaceae bacterium]